MSRVVTSAVAKSVVAHRRRRAVVVEAGDAGERPGEGGVEGDELAAVLAVEAEVAIGLLDDAVRLARGHEAVLGDADVDPLTAAAQRQHDDVGPGGADGPDGDRAVEAGDGAAERLDDAVPIGAGGERSCGRRATGSPWRRW